MSAFKGIIGARPRPTRKKKDECDGLEWCANSLHAHGPREPVQLSDGMWVFCRHWTPGQPLEALGPMPHPHTRGEGAVSVQDFRAWEAEEVKRRERRKPKAPPRMST